MDRNNILFSDKWQTSVLYAFILTPTSKSGRFLSEGSFRKQYDTHHLKLGKQS